jgi:hypothetical protein
MGAAVVTFCFCAALLGCSGSAGNSAGSAEPQTAVAQQKRTVTPSARPPSPSSYNQTCEADDDCIGVAAPSGPTACTNCVMAAINKADKEKYDQALSAAGYGHVFCPCPFPGVVHCVGGSCVVIHELPKPGPATPAP